MKPLWRLALRGFRIAIWRFDLIAWDLSIDFERWLETRLDREESSTWPPTRSRPSRWVSDVETLLFNCLYSYRKGEGRDWAPGKWRKSRKYNMRLRVWVGVCSCVKADRKEGQRQKWIGGGGGGAGEEKKRRADAEKCNILHPSTTQHAIVAEVGNKTTPAQRAGRGGSKEI